MYCGISEAFNSPLKQQLDKFNKQSIDNNGIVEYPHPSRPFFNAQGDMDTSTINNDNNIDIVEGFQGGGTDLKDLNKGTKIRRSDSESNASPPTLDENITYNDSVTLNDFTYSGTFDNDNSTLDRTIDYTYGDGDSDSMFSIPKPLASLDMQSMPQKPKRSHEYYIRSYIRDMKYDTHSLSGTQYEDVHDHVKDCRYCKSEIKKQLSVQFNTKPIVPNQDLKLVEKPKKRKPVTFIGEDVRELIIVVFVGIVVMVLLDALVKISSRVK